MARTKILSTKTSVRPHTIAIVGVALGDEGKGRIVDNSISTMLQEKKIEKVYVIRYQGGSNAGHTIEYQGKRIALHQVPSGIFYSNVTGFMDRGMVIHPEDLAVEIKYVEEAVGDTQGKLFLSEEAILVTDLERAEELLNRKKQGKAAGGTGRGIGPAYAHHYDRLGLHIHDLMSSDWKEMLSAQYERYTIEFAAFQEDLSSVMVPDFYESKKTKTAVLKKVGTKKDFLDRMGTIRSWLIQRKLVANLFPLHTDVFADKTCGVLFEGAQAVGLHPWLGTIPDTTASNTSAFGIQEGTAFWKLSQIEQVVGVFKITYTSSVGARQMPTYIDLPKDKELPLPHPTKEQEWATYVVTQAHEYGTTTRRRRDINYLDLPMLSYNCTMTGVTSLAGTHLDIARKTDTIRVCVGYKDQKGNPISYQPGLRFQKGVIPDYVELSGWDGSQLSHISSIKELPTQAKKYIEFLENYLNVPLSCVTTGAGREQLLRLI